MLKRSLDMKESENEKGNQKIKITERLFQITLYSQIFLFRESKHFYAYFFGKSKHSALRM